jgi:hypothetical protein
MTQLFDLNNELLLNICAYLIPTLKVYYGQIGRHSFDYKNMNQIAHDITTFKLISSKFRECMKYVIKSNKPLVQLLFLQSTNFNFGFSTNESRVEYIECDDIQNLKNNYFHEDVEKYAKDLYELLTLKNYAFNVVKLCCSFSVEWLPIVNSHLQILDLSKVIGQKQIFCSKVIIGDCGSDHEWMNWNKWENCDVEIIKFNELLKKMSYQQCHIGNSLICKKCNVLDYYSYYYYHEEEKNCHECKEPIEVDLICFECTNLCSCLEHYDDFDYWDAECGSLLCDKCFEKIPNDMAWRSKSCHSSQ